MTRGVCWFLVGSLVLVTLVGCGRGFVAQREPWRHEAEVACLKSDNVEGPGAVRIAPIEGPGICGADFPLQVTALGEQTASLGFADDLRPPAAIPNASPAAAQAPRWPIAPRAAPPAGPAVTHAPVGALTPIDAGAAAADAPLSLTPPGVAPPVLAPEPPAVAAVDPDLGARRGNLLQTFDATPLSEQRLVGMPRRAAAPPQPEIAPVRREAAPPPEPEVRFGPPRGPMTTGAIPAVTVKPTAKLACPIVSALDKWITTAVQPAAMRWFGRPVAEIRQISAYSCRGMNGNPNARISEHAFGNALDIAAFILADGHKITIKDGWHGTPEEQGFLHDVQLGACDSFTTVLAPGSNRFHYNHIHVDLMRRRHKPVICKPHAVSGEVAAARARARLARRGAPLTTGSIGDSRQRDADAASPDHEDPSDDDHAFIGHALDSIITGFPFRN